VYVTRCSVRTVLACEQILDIARAGSLLSNTVCSKTGVCTHTSAAFTMSHGFARASSVIAVSCSQSTVQCTGAASTISV
jgi:hypothetical protein